MDKCGLSLFDNLIKNNENNYLKPYTKSCWIDYCNSKPDWWQTNNDRHFGKLGHKEFFEYLYRYIQKL